VIDFLVADEQGQPLPVEATLMGKDLKPAGASGLLMSAGHFICLTG